MKRILLSEVEINDLLDLYQSEIDRAQRRINNLKNIVRKLSEGQSTDLLDEKPAKVKAKRGRKPNAKPVESKPIIESTETKVKRDAIVKEPKKRGRKRKIIKVKGAPKKRGRKPKSLRKPIKGGKGRNKVKWNDFIIETITSKNSLMLASSLTQAALEKFQIPPSDRDRVRMAISTTLTKMTNKDKVLQTHSEKGIRGAFFGLTAWFNDKSQITKEYKKKLM